MATAAEPGLGLRFSVKVDRIGSLGDWQKCEGLVVEYDIYEYKEGGQNAFTHRLPGRAKYQNIKLSRPMNSSSSQVAAWVSAVGREPSRTTAVISVLDAAGTEVAHWNLDGAFPARWSGPTLDVGATQAAIEILEIAHNGFIPG